MTTAQLTIAATLAIVMVPMPTVAQLAGTATSKEHEYVACLIGQSAVAGREASRVTA